MKLIKYPTKDQWTELLKRPALNTESLFDTVRSIIDKVRAEGVRFEKPMIVKMDGKKKLGVVLRPED